MPPQLSRVNARQYDNAIELLGKIFAEHPQRTPELIVKIGGGTAACVRRIRGEGLVGRYVLEIFS